LSYPGPHTQPPTIRDAIPYRKTRRIAAKNSNQDVYNPPTKEPSLPLFSCLHDSNNLVGDQLK